MVEARRHFELAVDAGDAEAQFNLAVIVESELAEGAAEDANAAAQRLQVLELYRKSADGGFAPALFNLGTLHYHGCPLVGGTTVGSLPPPAPPFPHTHTHNTHTRAHTHARARARTHTHISLSFFFSPPSPLSLQAPPDHALAARFWRQAVDAGDDRSAFNLAICYANGTYVH